MEVLLFRIQKTSHILVMLGKHSAGVCSLSVSVSPFILPNASAYIIPY